LRNAGAGAGESLSALLAEALALEPQVTRAEAASAS